MFKKSFEKDFMNLYSKTFYILNFKLGLFAWKNIVKLEFTGGSKGMV